MAGFQKKLELELQHVDPFALPFLPFNQKSELPNVAAVYFVIEANIIMYVGQAKHLVMRWVSHHRTHQINSKKARISWFTVSDVKHLKEAEAYFIKKFQPKLNGTLVCIQTCSQTEEIFCEACKKPIEMNIDFLAQAKELKRLNFFEGKIDLKTIKYYHNRPPCSTVAQHQFNSMYGSCWLWDTLKGYIPTKWKADD